MLEMLLATISFCLIAVINCVSSEGFLLIGEALEIGQPCDTGVLTMSRYIGGPPSKENNWNGTVYFDKYPNLPEARITLKLTAPATVTVDSEEATILVSEDAYHISYFKPPDGYREANFHVQGPPFKDFPNIAKLILNGEDICPNITEWKPSIIGLGSNIGSIDDKSDPNTPVVTKTCGQRLIKHQGLITNGFPSQEGDWPWHAGLYHLEKDNSWSYKCGGTLISSTTILTAAHCVIENGRFIVSERVLIKLGQHNRLVAGRNTQEFRVFRIIPHDEFNFSDLRNDIALLKLSSEVTLTNYVQPVCLWPKTIISIDNVVNDTGSVVGWGFNENDKLQDILTQANLPIVSLTTCLNSNRAFFGFFLSDNNFCAGYRNGTNVCNGDSGGGIVFQRDGAFNIRGIVSIGASRARENICNPQEYVIFTDVAKYLDWIGKYE